MRNETQNSNANRKQEAAISNASHFARKETTMNVSTLMKASMLTAALALACLLPSTARAQAEVAPDIYDIAAPQTIAAAQPVDATAKTQTAADFDGKFSLPYQVNCSGTALAPGVYSLSVKSEGSNRVVTIHRDGEEVNLPVREVSQRPALSSSALLLRRAGPARTLEAVYVHKLNAVLYLDGTANAKSNQGRIERLPIS
jgi:hypothetical protein